MVGQQRNRLEPVRLEHRPPQRRWSPPAPLLSVRTSRCRSSPFPCQMESRAHALEVASALKEDRRAPEHRHRLQVLVRQGQPHQRVGRARALDSKQAPPVFAEIRSSLGLPGAHRRARGLPNAPSVGQAVDVLQIPAFLCRQTTCRSRPAATGKVVNVKKGEFLAPGTWRMSSPRSWAAGNLNVLLHRVGGIEDDRTRPDWCAPEWGQLSRMSETSVFVAERRSRARSPAQLRLPPPTILATTFAIVLTAPETVPSVTSDDLTRRRGREAAGRSARHQGMPVSAATSTCRPDSRRHLG